MSFFIKDFTLLPIAEKDRAISIEDRGFLFGDGAFETCQIFNDKIYNRHLHLARLSSAIASLDINLKAFGSIDDIFLQADRLIKKNNQKNGLLKIIITRGIGSIGYSSTSNKPTVIITTNSQRIINNMPISLAIDIETSKNNSLFLGDGSNFPYKSLNSANYIKSKMIAEKLGTFENLIFATTSNKDGPIVAETSSANVFWFKNGKLFTPSNNANIVLGTIRARIIELAQMNLVENINFTLAQPEEIIDADEIFLTNASQMIIAVNELRLFRNGIMIDKILLNNTQTKKLELIMQKDRQNQCC
jgi:branched-subunit amino acid aminotransferase/4-amino-4-deoxychorismate lyase